LVVQVSVADVVVVLVTCRLDSCTGGGGGGGVAGVANVRSPDVVCELPAAEVS